MGLLRSKPMLKHQSIAQEELTRIVVKETASKVCSISTIADRGLCNAVYKIETDHLPLILRVNKASEVGTYTKERWCADLARAQGILTPKVLAVGKTEALSFHISEYVEGEDLLDLPRTARSKAWRDVGVMLQKLHQVSAQGFGEDLAGSVHGGAPTTLKDWADWFKEYCCESGDLIHQQVLNVEQHRKVIENFDMIGMAKVNPVVCHGNAVEKNFRIDKKGRTWLLDWGTASGHSPLLDIAELQAFVVDPEDHAAFYTGYGQTYSGNEHLLHQLTIARLTISIAWLLRENAIGSKDIQAELQRLHALLRGI